MKLSIGGTHDPGGTHRIAETHFHSGSDITHIRALRQGIAAMVTAVIYIRPAARKADIQPHAVHRQRAVRGRDVCKVRGDILAVSIEDLVTGDLVFAGSCVRLAAGNGYAVSQAIRKTGHGDLIARQGLTVVSPFGRSCGEYNGSIIFGDRQSAIHSGNATEAGSYILLSFVENLIGSHFIRTAARIGLATFSSGCEAEAGRQAGNGHRGIRQRSTIVTLRTGRRCENYGRIICGYG